MAKSVPDGHTIGIVVSSYSINPALRKSMPYDTLRDLSGVTLLTCFSMAIAANPNVPFNDVKGMVEYAKRNPGKLAFATPGSVAAHIKSQRLRPLAVTSPQPSPLLPGLPTVAESGYPGFEC